MKMETAVIIFLCGVVVTLIGWIAVTRNTHLLASKRESKSRELAAASAKANRLRDFRAVISSIRDSFDRRTTPNEELVETHQACLPRIREECAKILGDISDSNLPRFEAARNEYLSLSTDDIENRDHNQKPPDPADKFGNYRPNPAAWRPPPRYDRKRITDQLSILIECAT